MTREPIFNEISPFQALWPFPDKFFENSVLAFPWIKKLSSLITTFLLLSLSFNTQAFDFVSLFSSTNENIFPVHEEYDFAACAPYATETRSVDTLRCDLHELSSLLDNDIIKNQQEISQKVIEQALTEDFRAFILKKIEARIEEQERLKNCFTDLKNGRAPISSWCQNKAQVIREETRHQLPLMRRHLSMMTPTDSFDKRATYTKIEFEYQPRLRHSRSSNQIPPITEAEVPNLKLQFDEETQTYQQEWFASISEANDCARKDSEGLYHYKNPSCEQTLRIFMNDSIRMKREQNKIQHEQIYQHLVTTSPHLTFISEYPLPNGDEDLNKILAKSFEELLKQSQDQLKQLEARRTDRFQFLYRYPQFIEAFLQEKGQSQLLCDAFQNLHDYHGAGGWYDLVSDLGLAAGAIIGGGACVLTSGLACAAVVAIGAETLFLSRDQGHLDDGLTLYRAGMIDSDHLAGLERDRNFSLALAPLSFVGLEAGKGVARGFARRHLSRSSLKETQHWLNYNATTPLQNRLWITAARGGKAQVYLDVENAALKRLNDSLGDKNLVTALTNLHKDLLFKEIEKLKEIYPGMNIERYSDFKSSRFAFSFTDGNIPSGFQSQLNELVASVGKEFDNRARAFSGLELAGELPSSWFAAGLGESADQAGLAARQARTLDRSQNSLKTFEEIAPLLSLRRSSIEATRKVLEERLKAPPLNQLLVTAPSGQRVPSIDVFEVLRKTGSKSIEELQQVLKARFNLDLPVEETLLLREYAQEVDQFSPGLWIEERVLANLDEAEFGGFSADFKGMGARNLYQVAADLSHSGDTLAENVDRLRAGEGLVTESFDTAKSGYDELIKRELNRMGVRVTNRCSGDDCVSLPATALTFEQERQIVEAIARNGKADAYRLSFIPPGIRLQDRTVLSVHGELIEKQMRSVLSGYLPGQVSPEIMSQVTFAIRMPSKTGLGKVEVITATDPKLVMTDELSRQIQLAVAKATDSVNESLGTQYGH